MTIRIGSQIVAPGLASDEEFLAGESEEKTATVKQLKDAISRSSAFPLLTPMRSPHLLNSVSWLRADTFSWHNGSVYVTAYNLLENLYTSLDAVTETETINGITITYKKATNGMKICTPNQELNLSSLYDDTGVSWYYVIDTTNKNFKLPRNKFDFTGFRGNAGDYVPESLPNITGSAEGLYTNATGAFYSNYALTDELVSAESTEGQNISNLQLDASRSSQTYANNAPVQERAIQTYLYFYVGRFAPSSLEQTAGVNIEILNDKADKEYVDNLFAELETLLDSI